MKTATDGKAAPPGPPIGDDAPTLVTPEVRAVDSGPPLPSVAQRPRQGPGLGTKFFVAAAVLVAATLGAAVAVATWRANLVAERSIREALSKVPGAIAVYRSDFESQLRATVHSIADEPGTKSLFDEANPETRLEWAATKAKLLSAKTVFLFDEGGLSLTRSDRGADAEPRSFKSVKWVAEPIESWADSTASIREGSVISAVASAAVVAGDKARNEARLRGVVAAAVPYDGQRMAALKGIMGGQVGLVANTARRGEPPKLAIAAATPGLMADALVPALPSEAVETLFGKGQEVGPLDLDVRGDRRLVKGVPLKNASGETLGAILVSRSREEETAAFREIRNTLLLIGLASILVAIPVSLAMGHRITRRLEQLAAGAVAIRDGNLDVTLPEGGGDEVGALARAFSAMVGDLREKAQLEELLADMRRRSTETRPAQATPRPGREVEAEPFGPPVTALEPVVGKVFAGRYQILSTLGKGGMGSVFRALDTELDDEVALKVLTPEAFDEGTLAVQTLKQEIRLARKITHPNVVRTHDLGESFGVRFLTMEYVPGTTLREVIDRRGAVALAPGIQIAKQVCRGLAAVHEAGIIHRDIKPHNIMVLPNGVVKLMDFGIAKSAEGMDDLAAGQTVGTPFYMSPEQARGEGLDQRSDLYSVGVVLYELFTGELPIEGQTAIETMRRHVTLEPRRPSQLRPDIPVLLERLILACLAKTKEKRPPSANDLYGALMRLVA